MAATAGAAARRPARSPGRPKTKWGDREGRRRDILEAARHQIEHGGYRKLNMRDVAAGAGVSPGTLYSYFATKEEIFATLYAEAIAQHNERIAPLCASATDVEVFLAQLARAYLDLYAAYGRYFTQWAELQADNRAADGAGRLPPELGASLRAATFHQGEIVLEGLRRAAASSHVVLDDDVRALTFLWTVLNGIGDHVTSDRRHLTPVTTDELISYAAATIARGITAPR